MHLDLVRAKKRKVSENDSGCRRKGNTHLELFGANDRSPPMAARRGSTRLTHTHLAEAARARDRRVGEILAQYAAASQGGIAKVVHLGTHRGGADVERIWTELLPAEIPELAAINLELISGQTARPFRMKTAGLLRLCGISDGCSAVISHSHSSTCLISPSSDKALAGCSLQ